MRLLEPLWIALGTYSIVPSPRSQWTERGMRYAICCLPAVGLLLGGALLLWHIFCERLQIDGVLFAAVAAALPLLLTGGIHMDGYMDTVDALASHQPMERKLEIMKDSHCGAFAVMYCALYLLISFSLYHAVYRTAAMPVVALGFVLSRTLTALSAMSLPNARKAGMLCAFTEHAEKRGSILALCCILAVCVAGMICLSPFRGSVAFLFGMLTYITYRRMAVKQFGGATGDTTGFFLQISELFLLAGVWLGGLL